MERALFVAGAIPFLILGFLHVVYTFVDMAHPAKLVPRDTELMAAMKQGALRLTAETNIWKAWVGFNISHGVGVFFFGLIYFYLSIFEFQALQGFTLLYYLAPILATIYLGLSLKFWFRIPAIGSAVGVACFAASLWLSV